MCPHPHPALAGFFLSERRDSRHSSGSQGGEQRLARGRCRGQPGEDFGQPVGERKRQENGAVRGGMGLTRERQEPQLNRCAHSPPRLEQ